MTKYFWYGLMNATFLVLGLWIGVVGTVGQQRVVERRYLQTVYTPAPCHDYTVEMHELRILREAVRKDQENREAKEIFNSGRDPFQARWK